MCQSHFGQNRFLMQKSYTIIIYIYIYYYSEYNSVPKFILTILTLTILTSFFFSQFNLFFSYNSLFIPVKSLILWRNHQAMKEEYNSLKCHFGTSNKRGGDRRALPYVFTQQGVGIVKVISAHCEMGTIY